MRTLPHIGLYRRVTAAAWVVGPALFLIDNLLHPKEFSTGHEAEQLAEIAEHYTRWQLAHVLGLAAIFLFVPAALGLAFLVRRRAPTAGLAGGALCLVGAVGFASVIGLDGFAWGVAGEVSRRGDPATAQLVLHDLQSSEWGYAYYLPSAGFLLGPIVLGVTAVRTGALPAVAGVLLVLAGAMVGLETTIHSNAFYVAGSVVLQAAGVAVAATLWRMRDEDYAGIGSSASAP
jgi:uncharacterized protein DUF4386